MTVKFSIRTKLHSFRGMMLLILILAILSTIPQYDNLKSKVDLSYALDVQDFTVNKRTYLISINANNAK